jgi:hypothetical protein
MLKRVEALQKFLKAVSRLAKNRDITIDEVYEFAKKEFGEVSDLMKLQINKIFKEADAPSIRKPKPEGEVIEASFKPGRDKTGKVVEESESQRLGLASLQNPRRPGGGLDPLTGMTRTAARVVLDRYGIKIPDRADAIDIFEDNFGGDALMDLKDVADELIEKEQMGRITESMGEFLESRGMFDLKVDKTARKGMSNKELLEKMEEAEAEDILKKFDPEDREPNSKGGINRTSYAIGSGIRLAKFLAIRGKTLKDEIKKAIDNFIQPSGDTKYDADVVLDDMLEELGTSRDEIDQKDIIDAYGQVYDELIKPVAQTVKNKPAPFTGKGIDLPDDVDPRETILPTGDVVSKQLKIMRLAEDIQPGLFEKLTDKQLDIIVKYGDRIDEDLLKSIVLDPDPSNQAAAVATLDEVQTMMDKGMSTDEIMNALQSTPRRKQAEGGLSYLMGM